MSMMFGGPMICDRAVDADFKLAEEKLSFLQATKKSINKTVMDKKKKASLSDARKCVGFFILKSFRVHLKMKDIDYSNVAERDGTVVNNTLPQ